MPRSTMPSFLVPLLKYFAGYQTCSLTFGMQIFVGWMLCGIFIFSPHTQAYDQVVSKFPFLGVEEEFNEAPSARDYVGIINDTLLMKKSVGILFHMAKVEVCRKSPL